RQGDILLRAKSGKRALLHASALVPRDGYGGLVAAAVDDDTFFGKGNAVEAIRDIGGLVLGNDDDAQSRHGVPFCLPSPVGAAVLEPPPPPAGLVAQYTKWQGEVILADDLPGIAPAGGDGRGGGNIPAVKFGVTNETISGSPHGPVFFEIGDMVFQQDKARPPPRQIEPLEHFDFVTLDVDRDKIQRRLGAGF